MFPNYFDVLGFSLLSFPLLLSLPDLRSGKCSLYENSRLLMPERLPPLSCNMWLIQYYFLNLLRPYPARPTRPVPSSISVAGSGTGEGFPPLSPIGTVLFVSADGFETEVDVVYVGRSSFCGQPAIPKNIIKIHRTINNFFIFFPFTIKM